MNREHLLRAFRIGLFIFALGPSAAPAAGPQEGGTAAAAQPDPRGKETERLLRLADGRVVRARSRWVDGTWQVRSGAEWRPLPAGSVEEAREARTVLAEASRLASEVGRGDLTQRVALADWMIRQGLAQEGLEQLDRVLRSEPDHAPALKLLADPPQPLSIAGFASEDPASLLRAAADAPPAVRELAILRLAQVSGEGARELLAASLTSHSIRTRALAALALRRLCPGAEVAPLAVRSILDGSDEVRREASLSLKAAGQEAVILPAVRALSSSSEPVRANAIEALGYMGYPAAVPPLMARLAALQSGAVNAAAPHAHIFVGRQLAYIQDFDVEVAQGAAVADPVVNTLVEGSLLDARVIGMHVFTTAVETTRIRRSLALLTGEERSAKGWLEWWEEHQGDFTRPPPKTGERPATG